MWKIQSFWLSSLAITQVVKNTFQNDPDLARKNAKKNTRQLYNFAQKYLWVEIEYRFWETDNEEIKQIYKDIELYIYEWIETENFLKIKLWLWNHQPFWLEALWAYDYFPTNWRIVLKDDLLKIPWIKSIDPIVHYRNKWKESTQIRHKEIIDTLLNNKSVLVYPQWTRPREEKIRWFNRSLYSPAYDIITDTSNKVSSLVWVVTSDTMWVLWNKKLEEHLMFMWNVKPWKIIITIDIIDASLYENIIKFNDCITWVMWKNLLKNTKK